MRGARCPRSRRPPGRRPRCRGRWVSRRSRRVSSAATTSAPASSAASRGEASSTRPIGVPASTSTPRTRPGCRAVRSWVDHRSRSLAVVSLPVRLERAVGLSRTAAGRRRPDAASVRARLRARDHDPVIAWVGTARGHPARRLPAAVGPRQAPGVPVRRDLLRQGRLVAAALRLRRQNYVEKANEQILAGHTDGPVDRHPGDGGAPRGRQVADRAGRADLRDDAVRLADRLGDRRLADGDGDDPAGPPGHPLDAARPGRRPADVLRRACSSCSPGWPCSTSSWRSSCSARSAAWSPTATGSAPGWPPGRRGHPPGRRRPWGPLVLWRPWRLATGVFWGLAIGTKWSALFPLAAFGLLIWVWDAGARRSFGVRRAAAEVGRDRRPARPWATSCCCRWSIYLLTWTGWLLHAGVYEQHLSNTQYGPYWGSYLKHRRARVLPRAVAVAALAVALPPRRLRLPHRLPQRQHPRLPVQPVGLAGAEPAGRASTPSSTSRRASRAARRRPARPACARCCCSATRWCGGSGRCALVWSAVCWIGAPRLALRPGRGRRAASPGCRGCATTTGRSSATTRS